METSPTHPSNHGDAVQRVLATADELLPTELPFDEDNKATVFAIAAIRRMADLIDAELRLASQDRHSVTRVLGRSVIELWLYANELLLEGDEALDRLFGEDADQRARLEHGRRMVWDRLESRRAGGIDMRDPAFVPGERIRTDVEALAIRVRALREGRGFGGGLAEVRYELHYRWDSVYDVHVTVDHLFRYLDLDGQARILREPPADDVTPFRGWESVIDDARLLVDILGVYLDAAGRQDDLNELRSRWATPDD